MCESDESDALPIEADPEWLDWAPFNGPLFFHHHESPAEMLRRQDQWPAWRRRLGKWLGLLVS